jgi:hypothetical protein
MSYHPAFPSSDDLRLEADAEERDVADCSATIRMVAGDNQDGYLRHRLAA